MSENIVAAWLEHELELGRSKTEALEAMNEAIGRADSLQRLNDYLHGRRDVPTMVQRYMLPGAIAQALESFDTRARTRESKQRALARHLEKNLRLPSRF